MRYQASAAATYTINENLSLVVNAYYGYEKKAQEIVAGAMLGYGFYERRTSTADNTIYFGLYHRGKDALAPLAGYQFKTTRILLSYDVTLSRLVSASKANGGPEISLVHTGSFFKHFGNKKVYCPSFR